MPPRKNKNRKWPIREIGIATLLTNPRDYTQQEEQMKEK